MVCFFYILKERKSNAIHHHKSTTVCTWVHSTHSANWMVQCCILGLFVCFCVGFITFSPVSIRISSTRNAYRDIVGVPCHHFIIDNLKIKSYIYTKSLSLSFFLSSWVLSVFSGYFQTHISSDLWFKNKSNRKIMLSKWVIFSQK